VSQRDELEKLVGALTPDKVDSLAQAVSEVLAKAQNQPPEGMADGSIDEATFDSGRAVSAKLSELAMAIRDVQLKLKRLKAGLKNDPPNPQTNPWDLW
jgi:hypothetical protein